MKTFRVTVDGKSYNVQVEEVTGNVPAVSPARPVSAPAPAPAPEPVQAAEETPVVDSTPPPAGAQSITSPMPGTILDMRVAVGDVVEKNQVLLILEAMKMENEIVAPEAGTIVALHVGKGSTVETNDLMVSIN